MRDLSSNDPVQKKLETAIGDPGFVYRRHRGEASKGPADISSATAAVAVLSVWRKRPHQAKFHGREHFGKLYDIIFSDDLNAAQTVVAVLVFRYAENKRRRPPEDAPAFTAYASCFLAMLMGRFLLEELGIALSKLDHVNFEQAKKLFEKKRRCLLPERHRDDRRSHQAVVRNKKCFLATIGGDLQKGGPIGGIVGLERVQRQMRRLW